LLEDHPPANDIDLSCELGYKKKNSAYTLLKRRYIEDCLEIMRFNLDERQFKSKRFYIKQKVVSDLTSVDVCLNRGLESEATSILNEAIKQARKYQLYGELILMYEKKLTSLVVRGTKEYQSVYDELSECQREVENIYKCRKLYYDLLAHIDSREAMNDLLEKLESIGRVSSADEVASLNTRSAILSNVRKKNYSEAIQAAEKYINIVKNSYVVGSQDNIAGGYYMLGLVLATSGDYAQSYSSAQEAVRLFKSNSINELKAIDLAMVCNVNTNDSPSLVSGSDKIINTKIDSKYAEYQSYLWSSLIAFKHDRTEYMKLLNRTSILQLVDQKAAEYLRILELIVLIKEQEYELAKARIAALKRKQSSPRTYHMVMYIDHIIDAALKSNSFSTLLNSDKVKEWFSSVEEWDPSSFEKIRYDNLVLMLS
jgi:tetratricopeptide (TPR) repeat protein